MAKDLMEERAQQSPWPRAFIPRGIATPPTHDNDGENIFVYTTAEATALGVENPAVQAIGVLAWAAGTLMIIDGNGNTREITVTATVVSHQAPTYVRINGIRATGTTLTNSQYALLLP